MRNSVILHVIIVAVAAWVALRAANDTKPEEQAATELVGATVQDAEQIHYVSGPLDATIVRSGAKADDAWAVTLTREVKIRPDADVKLDPKAAGAPPAAPDGGPAAEEQTEVKTFRFPASRRVTRSIEKLLPLVPKRELGPVPAARLDKMGLGDDAGRLEITAAGQTTTFRLGRDMYGGGGRYIQSASGDVFLIDNRAVSGFDGDEVRSSERRVASIPLSDITTASFEVGPRARAYTHENRADAKDSFFAPTDKAEEQSESAMDAVSTLRRLKAKRFVDADSLDAAVKADVRARFRFARENKTEVSGTIIGADAEYGYIVIGKWVLAMQLKDHTQAFDVVKAAASAEPNKPAP